MLLTSSTLGSRGMWKSVSHKSRGPLSVVIDILTQREALCLSCWKGPARVEAHLVLVVRNLLRNQVHFFLLICIVLRFVTVMFHIIISYFVLFHEVLFLCQKQKMKGWCTWHRIKLELRGSPLLPGALLQRAALKQWQPVLFVCLFYCSVLSPASSALGTVIIIKSRWGGRGPRPA